MAYRTKLGTCIRGLTQDVLNSKLSSKYVGKIDLIFTSPPFPLNRKKKYDNLQGDEYKTWLADFAPLFKKFLKPTGSIVLEVGNCWEEDKPVMSTLPLESLLAFLKKGELNLCQQFVWHNPAKLPGPAQWVTVDRIRLKDSFTHLWSMAPSETPKADNRRVLVEYSKAMKQLLKNQRYNAGTRPSEHKIGAKSFLKDNGGAIPGSLLSPELKLVIPEPEMPESVLAFSNTQSDSAYQKFCRVEEIEQHPARMPAGLASFFIQLLTDPGDLVFDPFGGSNTTGATAESLNRRWLTIEPTESYVKGSIGRFPSLTELP